MQISDLTPDSLPHPGDSRTITAASLRLSLPQPPETFYRHGWQSWSLATWLDPREPPRPVRAVEFRMKDEDPVYALARNHVSAWVGAVEFEEDDILLLGALDLGGRLELDGTSLKGWYETLAGEWFLARGKEDEVFARYAEQLG